MKRARFATVAISALLLAGCGGIDGGQAGTPSSPSRPVAEMTMCELPDDYAAERPWTRSIPC